LDSYVPLIRRTDRSGGTLVFIPTFNDHECLEDIVNAVRRLSSSYTCLIVDDGSEPQIHCPSLKHKAMLCRIPDNVGIGVTTMIAVGHAKQFGYDAVVRVDSDGQHPVERIPGLLEALDQEDFDIVVGTRVNRSEGEGKKDKLRGLVRGYFSFVTRWLTNGNCPRDANSGFFAIGKRGITSMSDMSLGRFPEPEMILLGNRLKLRIGDLEVEQSSRIHGQTTLSFAAALRMILRFTVLAMDDVFRRF
jgi:glycosyltransferase involved in cell wall biosynthesis